VGAATWVSAFPEGQTRDNAINNVISGWTQNDPQGASKWLETMPAGKARDSAAQQLVGQLSYQEPALAAKWALELYASAATQTPKPGQPVRSASTSQLESLARNWMNIDEKAARAFIQQAPFSDETRKMLLAPRKP
jgi:hypothetical protein